MLRAPLDLRFDSRRLELFANLLDGFADEFLPLLSLVLNFLHKGIVRLRLEIAQTEILELHLDIGNAETICERCIDLERLLGNAVTFVLAHVFERAHIVQAVGKFDHDDADVLCHCKEHLAVVLELDVLL